MPDFLASQTLQNTFHLLRVPTLDLNGIRTHGTDPKNAVENVPECQEFILSYGPSIPAVHWRTPSNLFCCLASVFILSHHRTYLTWARDAQFHDLAPTEKPTNRPLNPIDHRARDSYKTPQKQRTVRLHPATLRVREKEKKTPCKREERKQ